MRRLNLSDAWIKQTERKKIYDEKQRVVITEQRQDDLLSNVVSNSWSFGLLKSRYNVSRQMKSNIDKHLVSSRGFKAYSGSLSRRDLVRLIAT